MESSFFSINMVFATDGEGFFFTFGVLHVQEFGHMGELFAFVVFVFFLHLLAFSRGHLGTLGGYGCFPVVAGDLGIHDVYLSGRIVEGEEGGEDGLDFFHLGDGCFLVFDDESTGASEDMVVLSDEHEDGFTGLGDTDDGTIVVEVDDAFGAVHGFLVHI